MSLTLTMPWPILKPLSPNWRGHWAAKAKAKRQLREAWFYQALEQGAQKIHAQRLNLDIVFHMPDKRHRDWDNLIASCKAGFDGLADALGVDDSRWIVTHSIADTIGGFVRVSVEDAT